MSRVQPQAIIRTNAGLLLVGPLWSFSCLVDHSESVNILLRIYCILYGLFANLLALFYIFVTSNNKMGFFH